MCRLFSGVAHREKGLLTNQKDPLCMSHEMIIISNGVNDDRLQDRDIVRLELIIVDFGDISTWRFVVDERGSLPEWFSDAEKYWESEMHDAAAAWVAKHVQDRCYKLTEYYKDGERHSECTFKDGERHGTCTTWHENGKKYSEYSYKDGEPHGKWTEWHANGEKYIERNYVNGKLHGKWTSWHENGEKKSERTYVNDKLHGKWTDWHANGKKESERNFKDGELHGKATFWRANGEKSYEGTYENGAPTSSNWQPSRNSPGGKGERR